jgi:nucleoside-diphosphate-sugar epimerase
VNILLTGGSGDLGEVLAIRLADRRDTAIQFDVRPPRGRAGVFVSGSILDRAALTAALREHRVDCVVHIAAWHGLHERQGKTADDFWELNVRGTFEVCEAAVAAEVGRLVFISSTSVRKPETLYGQSKILAEQVVAGYAARCGMRAVTLRPRAFVPHWNGMYKTFSEWAGAFTRGWVHIDDVAAAVLLAIDRTAHPAAVPPPAISLDGAYEFTDDDLATFPRHYPADYELAMEHGIDPTRPPRKLNPEDVRAAAEWGYRPSYSLRTLLAELRKYGAAGPPGPFDGRPAPGPTRQ